MVTDVDGGFMIEVPRPGTYQIFAGQTREYIGGSESVTLGSR